MFIQINTYELIFDQTKTAGVLLVTENSSLQSEINSDLEFDPSLRLIGVTQISRDALKAQFHIIYEKRD